MRKPMLWKEPKAPVQRVEVTCEEASHPSSRRSGSRDWPIAGWVIRRISFRIDPQTTFLDVWSDKVRHSAPLFVVQSFGRTPTLSCDSNGHPGIVSDQPACPGTLPLPGKPSEKSSARSHLTYINVSSLGKAKLLHDPSLGARKYF